MEKITNQHPESASLDIVQDNISKLKQLFPELITEDTSGAKIDVDVLKELVGNQVIDGDKERYNFTWHGKAAARRLAQTPSTGTLRPCKEESKDWDATQNLFIEGDNLEVLKLLQKSYHKKVKMIYIDPPYNTGKDFIYKDNLKDNITNYKKITGQIDSEGNSLTTNTETSGRYHTNWLNMMLPRLKLASNLLKDDGIIFISIDDTEIKNTRSLCDEIFGEDNFISCLIWEKGRKNDAKLISNWHEYILVYAKKKTYFQEQKIKWREAKPGAQEIHDEYIRLKAIYHHDFSEMEEKIREFYQSLPKDSPSLKHSRYNKIDEKGIWRDDNMSWPGGNGPRYDVIHPKTGLPCAVPDGGWRYSTLEKMNEMISLGKVIFRADHTEPPIKKTYLIEIQDEELDSEDENGDADDLPIQVAGSYF